MPSNADRIEYWRKRKLEQKKRREIKNAKRRMSKHEIEPTSHHLQLTRTSMMVLFVKLVSLSKFDLHDKYCAKGINQLTEIKEKFVQRKLVFPKILVWVSIFNDDGKRKCGHKITLMVNGRYLDTTLEEVIFTFTSYARDLELSEQTERVLVGKKLKTSKIKVKNEEFDMMYTVSGKCYLIIRISSLRKKRRTCRNRNYP